MKVTVYGTPAPQGSKTRTKFGGMRDDNPNTATWREAVKMAVMAAYPLGSRPDVILARGPVVVDITFSMPRPKSAKKFACADKKPDIDKLQRSTFDAMTEMSCWEDDARVVRVRATKIYAGDPGALGIAGAVIEWEALKEMGR